MTEATQIEQRLAAVLARIHAAEQRFGRPPGSVALLAVSKTKPAADIAKAASKMYFQLFPAEVRHPIDTFDRYKLAFYRPDSVQQNASYCRPFCLGSQRRPTKNRAPS